MGKWVEVQCNCANRVPLPQGRSFAQPYRNKHRLTNRQSAEVEHWKQTLEEMYECGHREGVVVAFAPNGLVHIGDTLRDLGHAGLFPRFVRIGDPLSYDDELLSLEPAEAVHWLTEIEALREALEIMGHPFSEIAGALIRAVFEPGLTAPREWILADLALGTTLGQESLRTGNPIRFLW